MLPLYRRNPRTLGIEDGVSSVSRLAGALAQMITSEQAAGLVTSGMWLDYGLALC